MQALIESANRLPSYECGRGRLSLMTKDDGFRIICNYILNIYFFKIYFVFNYMYIWKGLNTCECRYLWSLEESPESGIVSLQQAIVSYLT